MSNVQRMWLLILTLTFYCSGAAKANELDDIAACAGIVIGNAAVDLQLDDEAAFDEGVRVAITGYISFVSSVRVAITGYISFVSSGNFSSDELNLGDQIMASNTDMIINAANTETYDNAVYESVVGCYRLLSLAIIMTAPNVEANRALINETVSQKGSLIKRFIRAGR